MGNIDCAKILNENELSAVSGGARMHDPNDYTIQQGDTLSKIASKFGTTVEAILRANPDKDIFVIGSRIHIPLK